MSYDTSGCYSEKPSLRWLPVIQCAIQEGFVVIPTKGHAKTRASLLFRLRTALQWLHDHGRMPDRALVRVSEHPKGALLRRADVSRFTTVFQRSNGQVVELIGDKIIPVK